MELVHWAKPETISLILDYGAEIDKKSTHLGVTALHIAAFMGRLRISSNLK